MPVQGEAEVEVTRTFTCQTSDGQISHTDSNYVKANGISSGTIDYTSNHFLVGQNKTSDYSIYRGYLFFDTSPIPDNAEVTGVKLGLYQYSDDSSTDFNVTVQSGQPIYPHDPLQTGDYYHIRYNGDGGSLNTSVLAVGYNNVTFTGEGASWISVSTTTKLCLRSSRDINADQPSGKEYAGFYTIEENEAKAPKLYVTYTAEVFRYVTHGPYYENGDVFLGIINVTLTIENTESYSFFLNGTSGTADSKTIDVEQQGIVFTWNISSTDQNKTRTYSLTTEAFEEIYFFIPDTNEPFNIYTFTIVDFYGITDGHLETLINLEGTNRVVERQSMDVITSMPFWLTWSHSYTLRIICDQGSYTWGEITALSEYTHNLVISSGMFTVPFTGTNCTVTAERMNSTWIQILYTDHQAITDTVNITIKYLVGATWLTAYNTSQTGNSHTINWYDAHSSLAYVAVVDAERGGLTQSWSINIPIYGETENPWQGLLDVLGDWPVPASNVLGLGIVLAVFAAFSYRTSEVGTILAVLTAMMLTYIGWLQIPWALLALGFVIAVFAVIKQRKREEPLTI